MNGELSDIHTGRLIQDGAGNGAFNMAADLFLADLARRTSNPVLRLYTWERPTLSLGFHQRFSSDQLDRCRQEGLPVVRRPTGGRAVLHHRELTYCLSMPSGHPLAVEGRSELIRSIGMIFVAAACKIGLSAELVRAGSPGSERTGTLRKGSPLCFDSVSRWEVRLKGHKWIGSAQRFLPGVLLQHGSVLLGKSDVDIAGLLCLATVPPEGSSNSSGSKPGIDAEALRRSIPEAFSEYWNLSWREESFAPSEIEAISLSASSYQISPEWENSLCFDSEESKLKPLMIA